MNNPNPFVPKGSLLEQQNKSRSRVKLVVLGVVAANVLGLMALLIEGCKREQPQDESNNAPQVDTNMVSTPDTNAVAAAETNLPPTPPPPTAPPPPVQQVAAPTPPVVQASGAEYVVVKGDTLGKIARRNGVTVKALEAANPGLQPTKLKVGQKLSIPAGGSAAAATTSMASTGTTAMSGGEGTYTVKSGDTLTRIARAHGTTVKAIEAENNLSTTKIHVGQKLKIPASAAAAPVAAPVAPTPDTTAPQPPPAQTPAPAGAPAGQ
jgi:LysM repeat protein